jgi:cysteinyl-tRNA synthetase
MDDRSLLTDAEKESLRTLYDSWRKARDSGLNYEEADRLRNELRAWGCQGPDYESWHPVFELSDHREQRLKARSSGSIG